MHSGTKHPLLIFGTPLGNWYPLARSILNGVHSTGEHPYESWHRDLFGACATELEVGLSRKDLPKLEIPEHFKNRIGRVVSDGAANLESAGVSVYGCWTADSWLKALPSATCLVFYEHPALMISRFLAADATGSPEALLAIWSASAQKIVSAVRHHRDRLFLLDVDECLSFGEEYTQWVEKHLGITPAADRGASEAIKQDAVLHTFARVLCSENSLITKLVQELEASTQPLVEEWDFSGSGDFASAAVTALNELLALRRRSVEIANRDREIEYGKERALKKEEETLRTHEMLLLELHAALTGAEHHLEKWKAAESSIDLYKELALKKEKEAEAASNELQALRQRSGYLAAREHEIERFKEQSLKKEEEYLRSHEMLLMELHEALKESQRVFDLSRRAELSGGELSLKVDSVVRTDAREESAHRHINYVFQGVGLLGRHWPAVRVRLVQHLGRAGVAIFMSEGSEMPPLYGWKPSGGESGIPFMLFVPADAVARDALVRATTSDLVFIRDSVSLIHSDLRVHGISQSSRTNWIRVAERLLEEIEELPERLHYDSVNTALNSPAGQEPPFLFEVVNASFRGRIFSSLKFSWGPSFNGERFRLQLTDRARPPLSHWPRGDGDGFVHEVEVRRHWHELTRREKAFLRAILAEIPNFLVHAANQHPAGGIDLKRLGYGARISSKLHPVFWRTFPSRAASTASGQ